MIAFLLCILARALTTDGDGLTTRSGAPDNAASAWSERRSALWESSARSRRRRFYRAS